MYFAARSLPALHTARPSIESAAITESSSLTRAGVVESRATPAGLLTCTPGDPAHATNERKRTIGGNRIVRGLVGESSVVRRRGNSRVFGPLPRIPGRGATRS